MTCPAEFPGYKECDKMDACLVNAYTNIALDPANPTGIILDTSWNTIKLDLKSIVKAGETITHMELVPEDNPTAIRYTRESGEVDCITGDELSHIVSMHLLKDVDQNQTLENGDVYVYNSNTALIEPYGVVTAINDLNTYLGRLQASITSLQNQINGLQTQITNLGNRVTTLETKLTPPADAPSDVKVAFGNINLYSDNTNANLKTSGLYTHTLATDVTNDEYFS